VIASLSCFSDFVKKASDEFVFVPAKDEATVSGDLIPTRSRGHRCKTFGLKRKRRVETVRLRGSFGDYRVAVGSGAAHERRKTDNRPGRTKRT
jgi:hypothetical protein